MTTPRYSFLYTALIAFGFGFVLNLILPIALQLVLTALLTAATVLDPLHAGDRVDTLWTTIAYSAAGLLAFVLTSSIAFAATLGLVLERVTSRWCYSAAAAAFTAMNWLFVIVFAVGVGVATNGDLAITFALLFGGYVSLSSAAIALPTTLIARRRMRAGVAGAGNS